MVQSVPRVTGMARRGHGVAWCDVSCAWRFGVGAAEPVVIASGLGFVVSQDAPMGTITGAHGTSGYDDSQAIGMHGQWGS